MVVSAKVGGSGLIYIKEEVVVIRVDVWARAKVSHSVTVFAKEVWVMVRPR